MLKIFILSGVVPIAAENIFKIYPDESIRINYTHALCSLKFGGIFVLIVIMAHFTSLFAANMIYIAQKRDLCLLTSRKKLRFSLFSAIQYDTSPCGVKVCFQHSMRSMGSCSPDY